MSDLLRQLSEVAELIKFKHQPGQHDQSKHAGSRGKKGGAGGKTSSAMTASTLGESAAMLAKDWGGSVVTAESHMATVHTPFTDRGEVGAKLQSEYGFHPKAKPSYAKADEEWYQSGDRVARVGNWTAIQRLGAAARQPTPVWVTLFDED